MSIINCFGILCLFFATVSGSRYHIGLFGGFPSWNIEVKYKAMDEVSLVASEQQKFQKSIKGIKKLIKSGEIAPRTDEDAKVAKHAARRFPRKEKKPKKAKGLVYISHIPHGFYENEMTQYFRQFGVVTNVRVLRSSRTGRSKGAAFVQFLEPAVAEIVAETMNNYLMGKRLLKAVLIPPEKQKAKAFRKNWNTIDNPSSDYRRKIKKVYNENGSDADDLKLAQKQMRMVSQTKRKLKKLGIDYDFFQPVDIPEKFLHTEESSTQIEIAVKSTNKKELQTTTNKNSDKAQNGKEKVCKKDQKENVKIRKNQKVEKKKKSEQEKYKQKESEQKKTETKNPKFEGQDFLKISEHNKSKKNKRQDQSKEESEDSDVEFDSDAFDGLDDSDEFESEDQSDGESGDDDEPSDDEGGGDENDSDNHGTENNSEKEKLKSVIKKKLAPKQNKTNAESKPAQPAKQIGGKRKMELAPLKKANVGGKTLGHNHTNKIKKNNHRK